MAVRHIYSCIYAWSELTKRSVGGGVDNSRQIDTSAAAAQKSLVVLYSRGSVTLLVEFMFYALSHMYCHGA